MRRAGVFVTGTDTGVGKTIVAACLVRRWTAAYWKPVQTGLAEERGDTETVARFAEMAPARIHPPRYELAAPLSPEAAGLREGITIAVRDFTLPDGADPLVVEGAGGVLVPLGGGDTMAELMRHLGLPVVLVARNALGTLNHSLLSLEALRSRGIAMAGLVMVGDGPDDNAATIVRLGRVRLLGSIPTLRRLDPPSIEAAARALPPFWRGRAPRSRWRCSGDDGRRCGAALPRAAWPRTGRAGDHRRLPKLLRNPGPRSAGHLRLRRVRCLFHARDGPATAIPRARLPCPCTQPVAACRGFPAGLSHRARTGRAGPQRHAALLSPQQRTRRARRCRRRRRGARVGAG